MAFVEAIKLQNGHTLLPFPDRVPDPSDPAATEIKLFDFPANSINSVILGWKSEPELEKIIRKCLKKHKIQHVQLFKAIPHKFKFEMEILPITETAGG